jgi:hypothetical protein
MRYPAPPYTKNAENTGQKAVKIDEGSEPVVDRFTTHAQFA